MARLLSRLKAVVNILLRVSNRKKGVLDCIDFWRWKPIAISSEKNSLNLRYTIVPITEHETRHCKKQESYILVSPNKLDARAKFVYRNHIVRSFTRLCCSQISRQMLLTANMSVPVRASGSRTSCISGYEEASPARAEITPTNSHRRLELVNHPQNSSAVVVSTTTGRGFFKFAIRRVHRTSDGDRP